MRVETLLQRLEMAQARLAAEALEKPVGKEGYDYGRVVGMYAGLELAKTILIETVAERERNDFDL